MYLYILGLLKSLGIDCDPIAIAKYLWHHHHSKLDVLVISSVVITALYVYARRQKNYFKNRGIKNLPYDFPFAGNSWKQFTLREHMKDLVYKTYNAFPDQKYVGHMQINQPLIMIRDLELLKQIGIKEFDHFINHQVVISDEVDKIFGGHLFALKGDKWRDMRATLSPAFTSSKMKNMFDFITEIGAQMAEFYDEQMKIPENEEKGLVEIEMKDAFTRYANDIIATSAFGMRMNSFSDPNNEFYKTGRKLSDFSGLQGIKFFLFTSFPRIMKMLKVPLMNTDRINFFRDIILDTMKNRDDNGILRHDMINLLMEARKGSLNHSEVKNDEENTGFATVEESEIGKTSVRRSWSDDELVAQAFLFFLAGLDTTSTLLCFMAHELTVNPDVQKRLHEEIDEIVNECGNEIVYSDLMKMKYMDMVVSESLRKWPPAVATDRQCVKNFKLPPPSADKYTGYTVKVGEAIWIPVYGIHHDPNYYPDPEKFDPERFSDENKHTINPTTFIPFGIGPRNCIGSRFALMEIKSVVFHLLSKFEFVPTDKTSKEIKLDTRTFNLTADGGFWIGLKPRN